jgi:DNA adenine methylase
MASASPPEEPSRTAETGVRPILKWAGGKRQLLPEIRRFYPSSFGRYVEPFLGSGAVFLDCYNRGLLEGRTVRLSDINADVIGCYRMVRDAVEEVVGALRRLEDGHLDGGARHFYAVRDDHFNPARARLREHGDVASAYTPALAAMLIYLNRTGYNGLFRVNAAGAFNVPAGRYGTVRICDADNLRRMSRAFAATAARIELAPFELALADAGPEDFIYLDPPYAPVSRTAHFTAYTAGGFGPVQQAALQRRVVDAARRGARILLSNSAAPEIRQLYANDEARAAGLEAHVVLARRAINSRATARGGVREYLITNLPLVRRQASHAGRGRRTPTRHGRTGVN